MWTVVGQFPKGNINDFGFVISDFGRTPKFEITNPKYTEGVCKNGQMLNLFKNMKIAIGIDLGGTNVKGVLLNENGGAFWAYFH